MSIVTFYSYKGGVGRTLAMANVAVLLAKYQKKVLVVDWDLEAPGLEEYFDDFRVDADGRGLLFLLEKRDLLANHLWHLSSAEDNVKLDFLPSGRDEQDYYQTLERFNIDNFFSDGGGDFLEKIREEWLESYDFVLIDSRTGLSDTGGVCTILLPDIVVGMFTATRQSYRGVRDVLKLARTSRQRIAYTRSQFSIIPVPCRMSNTDGSDFENWISEFADAMGDLTIDWRPKTLSIETVLRAIQISHDDTLAHGTKIIDEKSPNAPSHVLKSYEIIARLLESNLNDTSSLSTDTFGIYMGDISAGRDSAVNFIGTEAYEYDFFISVSGGSVDSRWVEGVFLQPFIKSLIERLGREPRYFFDLYEISAGQEWTEKIASSIVNSRVLLAFVSARTNRSTWVINEIEYFQQNNTNGILVPIKLSDEDFDDDFFQYEFFDFHKHFVTNTTNKYLSSMLGDKFLRDIEKLADKVSGIIDSSE